MNISISFFSDSDIFLNTTQHNSLHVQQVDKEPIFTSK